MPYQTSEANHAQARESRRIGLSYSQWLGLAETVLLPATAGGPVMVGVPRYRTNQTFV